MEPSRESVLQVLIVWVTLSALFLGALLFLLEVWWRRHRPWWMWDGDEDDASMHEADLRG